MFEIDFMHWPNSQCLSLSISKWLFVKISIYHILMVNALKRFNLSDENDETFHMGQTICEITFEIYITNFIHVGSHFNYFWNIFAFLVHNYRCYFNANIFQSIMIYTKNYFLIYYLGYTITCKYIVKLFFHVDLI
jgi:hypothetical protein